MAEQTGNTMVLAESLILEAKKNRKERENRRKLKNLLLLESSRKRKTVVCSWFQVLLLLTNLQTVSVYVEDSQESRGGGGYLELLR